MKVLLVGKDTATIEKTISSMGFEIVKESPEIIISYGGDGTLLSAERQFPEIPKLAIRNSRFCNKCQNHSDEKVLENLLAGKLKLKEYRKLETALLYTNFYALNDFVVRNINPIHTIRFKYSKLNTGSISKLLIGDGIVASTPFGSTGYFKSITRQTFNKGFGIAFNNITEKRSPVILKDQQSLKFSLIRGQATLSFDNSPEVFTIDEGSEIIFKLSEKTAKIYDSTSLRCRDCEVIRD